MKLETKAIEGSVSIIAMLVIITSITYFIAPKLIQNGLILLIIVIIVGLANGYIFENAIKKSIVYIVVFGEILTGILFFVLYFGFQQDLSNNASNTGLEGLGLILIFIILFAVLVAGFIGFIILGVALYIPALIGKSFKKSNN